MATRGEKITAKCHQCPNQITRYVSQHRKFCSRKCKIESQKVEIVHPCDYCGKELRITPNRLKWSKARGRGRIFCDSKCRQGCNAGEGHANWIEDRNQLKDRRHSERQSSDYIEWRKGVFERDKFTCQKCGAVGGNLHAHHIKEWEYYPALRYELGNGMTLCRRPCHKNEHAARRANRKISDDQVNEIKILRKSGMTLWAIGEIFDVSESTVSMICAGKKRTQQLTNPHTSAREALTHGEGTYHPSAARF